MDLTAEVLQSIPPHTPPLWGRCSSHKTPMKAGPWAVEDHATSRTVCAALNKADLRQPVSCSFRPRSRHDGWCSRGIMWRLPWQSWPRLPGAGGAASLLWRGDGCLWQSSPLPAQRRKSPERGSGGGCCQSRACCWRPRPGTSSAPGRQVSVSAAQGRGGEEENE